MRIPSSQDFQRSLQLDVGTLFVQSPLFSGFCTGIALTHLVWDAEQAPPAWIFSINAAFFSIKAVLFWSTQLWADPWC